MQKWGGAKTILMGASVIVVLAVATLGYRNFQSCERWRDEHLRAQVAEMFKNSPVILNEERIGEQIGEPPWACTPPKPNQTDIARFRTGSAE